MMWCDVLLAAIVLPSVPTEVEEGAARELRDGILRMTGRDELIIREPSAPKGVNFFVGATTKAASLTPECWRYDEVVVAPVAGGLVLAGHPDRGAFYAVDTYLEDVCGVRWWTSTESHYPSRAAMPMPKKVLRHAPKIAFRETYFLDGFTNALFKVRSKGNFSSRTRYMYHPLEFVPKSMGGDHRLYYYRGRGSAYHSFFEVLPPKDHLASHPEWFSLVDGKRVAKQLCLTNEEMTRAYIAETLRLLREDPTVDFVSVSQNDWPGSCQCPACRAVVAEEGAECGLYLRFANVVAEAIEKEFPHVKVDTFAYQFTVQPPKVTRPRHNVVVRLCSYGIGVNEPYATRRFDRGFSSDLEAWSKIAAGRLFIWDYVVDFHNYILPHPNIRSLAPNVRQFADAGVAGVFEQGDALSSAGTFAALKHWYLAHLLWNTDADAEGLLDDFITGYYGAKAARHVRAYIDVFEDAAARYASLGGAITCTHTDISHFVTEAEARRARDIMNAALAAVQSEDAAYARRLRKEKLSLDHAFLLNYERWHEKGEKAADVEAWIRACDSYGVEARRETVERSERAEYDANMRESAQRFVPVDRVFTPEAATGAAIQKAIDAASAAGGGRVTLQPTVYPSGTLYLKSNVELHLPKGAVLRGGPRPQDYDDVDDPRIGKKPEKSSKVFIAALFQDNVAITGEGVIDGQGVSFYDANTNAWGSFNKPAHPRTRMIEFVGCRRVRFADVTLKDSPGWTCWLRMCRNVEAERVKIRGDQRMINNDGFHVDGCRYVLIRGCDIRTGDDCVVMRAIRTPKGESNRCEDMLVENCTLDSHCQAIRLGCPSDGTIHRGVFRNLRITGVNGVMSGHPVRYLQQGDHGHCWMSDLTIEDCDIDVRGTPISFWIEPGIRLGYFGATTFRNVRVKGGRPIVLQGTGDTVLKNVRFENVSGKIGSPVPLEMKNTEGIVFAGFDITSSRAPRAEPAVNTGDGWERIP